MLRILPKAFRARSSLRTMKTKYFNSSLRTFSSAATSDSGGESEIERESLDCDVLIVGGGPAGLSTAIKLKQHEPDLDVYIIEKGSHIGAHILSGNVFETRALNELFPDWKEMGAPLETQVTDDKMFYFSNDKSSISIPGVFHPKSINNHGNYIISLGQLCEWLAEQAEELGVEILPGTAGNEILFCEGNERVVGIRTGD